MCSLHHQNPASRAAAVAFGLLFCLSLLPFPGMGLVKPAAAATPAFGSGLPGYTVYPGDPSLPGVDASGEPSIGVNWNTGAVMYQANGNTYKVAFDDTQSPPTAAWADKTNPPVSEINIDPILFTDHQSGRTFAGGLISPCSNLFYTNNDGDSWTQVANPCTFTNDHETIGGGPFVANSPLAPLAATNLGGPAVTYYCAQSLTPLAGTSLTSNDACASSYDGGATFNNPYVIPYVGVGGCDYLTGHVKSGADGVAYLPNKNCGGVVGGAVTTNNGLAWSSYTIPGSTVPTKGFDPAVAITPDGTVYEAWADASNHPYVAHSTDHGSTWGGVMDLANTVSPPLAQTTFQAAVAGDNGRVAVAYLGSTSSGDPFGASFTGTWDLYVSTTFDGGATWTTTKVTTDPVQRGWICDGGSGCTSGRNLLDFIGADVDANGRVVVAFADGCINDCAASTGTQAQSTDAYSTIARQSSGCGLLAAKDAGACTASGSGGSGSPALALTSPAAGASLPVGTVTVAGTVNRAASGGSGALAASAGGSYSGFVGAPIPLRGAGVGGTAPIMCAWSTGDPALTLAGATGAAACTSATATPLAVGAHALTLTVTDANGAVATAQVSVLGLAGKVAGQVFAYQTTPECIPPGPALPSPLPATPSGCLGLGISNLVATATGKAGQTTPQFPGGTWVELSVRGAAATGATIDQNTPVTLAIADASGKIVSGPYAANGATDSPGFQYSYAPVQLPCAPGTYDIVPVIAVDNVRVIIKSTVTSDGTAPISVVSPPAPAPPAPTCPTGSAAPLRGGPAAARQTRGRDAPHLFVQPRDAPLPKAAPTAVPADALVPGTNDVVYNPPVSGGAIPPNGVPVPAQVSSAALSQLALSGTWFDQDAHYVYLGLKVQGFPQQNQETMDQEMYAVSFNPSWESAAHQTPTVAPGVLSGNTYLGLQVLATRSVVDTTWLSNFPSTLPSVPPQTTFTTFELDVLSSSGGAAGGNFVKIADLPLSSVDATNGVIWFVVPRAAMDTPGTAGSLGPDTAHTPVTASTGQAVAGFLTSPNLADFDVPTIPSASYAITPLFGAAIAAPSKADVGQAVAVAATALGNPVGAVACAWSADTGDAAVQFGNPSLCATTVTLAAAGPHALHVHVTDSSATPQEADASATVAASYAERVEVLEGTTLLGSQPVSTSPGSPTAPFSIAVSGLLVGSHTLTVRWLDQGVANSGPALDARTVGFTLESATTTTTDTGSAGGSVNNIPPAIDSLAVSPSLAVIGRDSSVGVTGTAHDNNGNADVAGVTVNVAGPAGFTASLTPTLTNDAHDATALAFAAASAVTSTSPTGTYQVDTFAVDKEGLQSPTVSTTFTVLPPPAVNIQYTGSASKLDFGSFDPGASNVKSTNQFTVSNQLHADKDFLFDMTDFTCTRGTVPVMGNAKVLLGHIDQGNFVMDKTLDYTQSTVDFGTLSDGSQVSVQLELLSVPKAIAGTCTASFGLYHT